MAGFAQNVWVDYDGIVAIFQDALREALGSRGIPVLASGAEHYVDGPNAWLARIVMQRR
jgi:hypothetical protein